jgi:hypothetical protein
MARRRRLKGPVRAVRVGAIRPGAAAETLTREAEERLFRNVEVLSEGAVRDRTWFGSTMITVDLEHLESDLRDPLDEEGRERLLRLVSGSVRVRIRAMRLARAEVTRRFPDRKLGTAQMETRIRLHGGKLHVDVDVEVPLGVTSARGR